LPPAAEAAQIHFRFGLTRDAEACWERDQVLYYRAQGRTWTAAKDDVLRIDGTCAEPEPGTAARPPAEPGLPSPSDQRALEELRQMAREAVRVYGLGSPIEVVIRPLQSSGLTSYAGVGMTFSRVRGQVSVDPSVLQSAARHTLMAVVLAS